MQIDIKRHGGFAGIEEHIGSLSTEGMNAAAVKDLNECLSRLAEEEDEIAGADMYTYEVTIRASGQEERVLLINGGGDPTEPDNDALRALCQLVSSGS